MEKKKRYTLIDILRGISVIAMIVYHAMWDLVYVHGVDIPWFFTEGASVFQSYIRWLSLCSPALQCRQIR